MTTQLPFMTLDALGQWLEQDSWAEQLELGSASLIEQLCNEITSADAPTFSVAYAHAETLLGKIDSALSQPDHLLHTKLAPTYAVLTNLLVEAGPGRMEVKPAAFADLLSQYRALRLQLVELLKKFFNLKVFNPLLEAIQKEVYPLLDGVCEEFYGRDDRNMAFRVLSMGSLAELIRFLRLRVDSAQHPDLHRLLGAIYDYKYVRFGTSGFRGVWERDFTEEMVKIVSQSICDFLKAQNMPAYANGAAEDLSGCVVVIGYDGRRDSPHVARLVAAVCIANGFKVYYASRPTPTPALNFFAREVIGRDRLAGLVNCTASHNPPEWQGIKFNPLQGYPAPTSLTDVIAARCNMRNLIQTPVDLADLDDSETNGNFQQFDPLNLYLDYLRESGQAGANNKRISVNMDNIKRYFSDKLVVLDPMYGSGRMYLSKLLGELGIPHTSIHDERDEDLGGQTQTVRGVPSLEYANPEPHFIQPLVDKTASSGAALGLGLDTDADRFGAVDAGGVYIRPNQILAMLTRYLGIERGETGRVVITQTGLPMINALAEQIPNNEANRPPLGSIPAYIANPFYYRRIGTGEEINFPGVYVVPVGIKYIIDVARVAEGVTDKNAAYNAQPDSAIPADWMDRLLIGGEESSGLTTRGHVPDKDGIWANLLIMDMLAYYGLQKGQPTSLSEIWAETTHLEGAWDTYGDRIDLDVNASAKESILHYYLDLFKDWKNGDPLPSIAGLEVYYLGGTRYDFVEIFLQDAEHGRRHFLRVRASGTEPILRVYAESQSAAIRDKLINEVLANLDKLNIAVLQEAYSPENMADLLTNTRFADLTLNVAREVIGAQGWPLDTIKTLMLARKPHVESRNAKLIESWVAAL